MKEKQSWTWEEFQGIFNEELDTKTSPWKTKMKMKAFKDNVKVSVYQKPQKGKVDLLRMEAEFQNIEATKMWEYITNPPKNTLLRELKTIASDGPNHLDIYYQVKLPLMSTRDNLLRCKRTILTDDAFYIQTETIDHPDYPPKKGIIRMFAFLGGYMRPSPTTPGNYLYTEISNFDMKGSIPVKLLNMSLASEAAKEMRNVAKALQKK